MYYQFPITFLYLFNTKAVFIAEGFANPQIAEKIFLSLFTVGSHRKNLLAKLNVTNTVMLIKIAVQNKVLQS
ncbi:MAG: response regulator transcription factor [Bacteroidia bacterium]|nr:response regulator transcription factor [Bacteroidia bacterium]